MTDSPAAPRDGLLEVGRVLKSHGLRGEAVLDMVSDRPERVARGAELVTANGTLTVAEARPHQGRWLVRFEGCTSREAADALRGTTLWAEPLDDDEELWVHELIGCTVLDADGTVRGTVESVQENPAADLLVLTGGTLVPVVFVVGPPSDGVVHVECPDGLFDL
jgi:16S rRNA processing protein RimM